MTQLLSQNKDGEPENSVLLHTTLLSTRHCPLESKTTPFFTICHSLKVAHHTIDAAMLQLDMMWFLHLHQGALTCIANAACVVLQATARVTSLIVKSISDPVTKC